MPAVKWSRIQWTLSSPTRTRPRAPTGPLLRGVFGNKPRALAALEVGPRSGVERVAPSGNECGPLPMRSPRSIYEQLFEPGAHLPAPYRIRLRDSQRSPSVALVVADPPGHTIALGVSAALEAACYDLGFVAGGRELQHRGLSTTELAASTAGRSAQVEVREHYGSAVLDGAPPLAVSNGRAPCSGQRSLELGFELRSPLRLKRHGRVLCVAAEVDAAMLIDYLLRRLDAIARAYTGHGIDDIEVLRAAARDVETIACVLQFDDAFRYSARQRRRVPVGGFTGFVRCRHVAPGLLPYLRAGEDWGVGSGCAYGLGDYTLTLES